MDITAIANKVDNYLTEMNIQHTEKGIMANLNSWGKNKKNLLEMFKKHPNFNPETLQITLRYKEKRPINTSAINQEYYSLFRKWHNSRVKDILDIKNNFDYAAHKLNIKNNYNYRAYFDCLDSITDILNYSINYFTEEKVCDDLAEALNLLNPNLKIRGGTKTSRVLRKIFETYKFNMIEGFEHSYAIIADALSPSSVEKVFILSLNPLDFLTMSNGFNWSTCYSLQPKENEDGYVYQGKHKAGVLSTLTDNASIIAYTLSNDYGVDNWKQPKLNREMLFYQNGLIKMLRIYPKSNDNNMWVYDYYEENIRKLFIEMTGDTYANGNGHSIKITTLGDNYLYPDWMHYYSRGLKPTNYCGDSEIIIENNPHCMICGNPKKSFDSEDEYATMNCYFCYKKYYSNRSDDYDDDNDNDYDDNDYDDNDDDYDNNDNEDGYREYFHQIFTSSSYNYV